MIILISTTLGAVELIAGGITSNCAIRSNAIPPWAKGFSAVEAFFRIGIGTISFEEEDTTRPFPWRANEGVLYFRFGEAGSRFNRQRNR